MINKATLTRLYISKNARTGRNTTGNNQADFPNDAVSLYDAIQSYNIINPMSMAAAVPSVDNIASIREYSGDSSVINVKDSTYTANGGTYTTVGGVFKRVSTGTENGGTLIVADNGTKWARDWDGVRAQPEWWTVGGYDANGLPFVSKNVAGGIYNDTDRINSASGVAGSGGTLVFQPSKIYITDTVVQLNIGQTFEGNNATIKRINAPVITVTANVAAGQTVVPVSSAANLRVGHNLLFVSGPNFDQGNGYADNYRIASISGNNVTLVNPLSGALTSGWNVMLNFTLVGITHGADNQLWTIKNLNFDGNKANNTYSVDWRIGDSIGASSVTSQGLIENCFFKDTPGENIVYGNVHIKDCRYSNLNGSFLHVSVLNNTGEVIIVEGCSGSGSNKARNSNTGHSEALITSSANTCHIRIDNCTFEDGDEAIITSQNSTDFDVSVSNCYFNNFFSTIFSGTAAYVQKFLKINNNTFYNCGPLSITGSSTLANKTSQSNITINDNTFVNCRVQCNEAGHVAILNNKFLWNSTLTTKYDYSTNVLNAQQAFFHFIYFDRVHIINNVIELPKAYASHIRTALMLQHNNVVRKTSGGAATEYLYAQDVKIIGNTIANCQVGISTTNTLTPQYVTGVLQAVGWEYTGNNIYMTRDAAGANGYGIFVANGVIAQNNTVYNTATSVAFTAYHVQGVQAVSNAHQRLLGGICVNNRHIGCPGSGYSIIVGSETTPASHNATCTDNQIRQDVFSGYAGTTAYLARNWNTDTTNYTNLSAQSCPAYRDFLEDFGVY